MTPEVAHECRVVDWLNANLASSPSGKCLLCGDANKPLLPFGGVTVGHVWLHMECWPAWTAGRRAAAEKGARRSWVSPMTAPRICFASLNEAAAQRAGDVARRWLPGGTTRRGQWRSAGAWLDLDTGRGGRSAEADCYSWRADWRDFAGMVAAIDGLRPIEAARRLAEFLSISGEADPDLLAAATARTERAAVEKTEREEADRKLAASIIKASYPLQSPRAAFVIRYLRSRNLHRDALLYPETGNPESIVASHDAFPDLHRLQSPLAMILIIRDPVSGTVSACHRHMLLGDGQPVYAPPQPGKPSKKIKLSLGIIKGCAGLVEGEPDRDGRWGLAEGGEDAMAARQLCRFPTWAAISAGNMRNVQPPAWARRLHIFADADDAGMAAASAAHEAWSELSNIEFIKILRPNGAKDPAAALTLLAGG